MTLDDLDGRLFASTPEVAAILGRDPRTLRRAAEAGQIAGARKVGKNWLFPVAWLQEQAGMAAPAQAPQVDYDKLADLVTDRLIARFARIFGGSGEAA